MCIRDRAEAIQREEEHPIAGDARGGEYPFDLVEGDNVGQALASGRLDQVGCCPGLAQDMFVVELYAKRYPLGQPIQIELDRAPGMRFDQIGEVVCQLRLGQTVDLMVKIIASPADGARVGLDGLRLQALELEVLQMRLVLPVEVRRRWRQQFSFQIQR